MHTTSVADPKNSDLAWSEEEQEKATNILCQCVMDAVFMSKWGGLRGDIETRLCKEFGYGAFAWARVDNKSLSICIRHPKKPETLVVSLDLAVHPQTS